MMDTKEQITKILNDIDNAVEMIVRLIPAVGAVEMAEIISYDEIMHNAQYALEELIINEENVQ